MPLVLHFCLLGYQVLYRVHVYGMTEGTTLTIGLLSLALILLVLLFYVLTVRGGGGDSLKSIPGPKATPLLGNIFEMIQIEAVDLFLQWTQMYGKILKYQIFLLGESVSAKVFISLHVMLLL